MRFQGLLAFAENVKLFRHLCHLMKSQQQAQIPKIPNSSKNIRLLHDQFNNHQQLICKHVSLT